MCTLLYNFIRYLKQYAKLPSSDQKSRSKLQTIDMMSKAYLKQSMPKMCPLSCPDNKRSLFYLMCLLFYFISILDFGGIFFFFSVCSPVLVLVCMRHCLDWRTSCGSRVVPPNWLHTSNPCDLLLISDPSLWAVMHAIVYVTGWLNW